jgi:hypothetical protein
MPGNRPPKPAATEPHVYLVRVWGDRAPEVRGFVRDLQHGTTTRFARRAELLQLLAPPADPETDEGASR